MNDPDKNEDIVFYGAFILLAILGAIGLAVWFSGHGTAPPHTSPAVVTMMDDTSRTP